MEKLKPFSVSICNGSTESCNDKFSAKIDFPTFYVTITGTDIGSLKSLHTLFDRYLDHMLVKFEQNRMIRNVQNFKLFGKKWLTILEKF